MNYELSILVVNDETKLHPTLIYSDDALRTINLGSWFTSTRFGNNAATQEILVGNSKLKNSGESLFSLLTMHVYNPEKIKCLIMVMNF